MKILDYGDIIPLRNITFEDGKYDTEEFHPGVVLIPTSEKDDEVVCLYMTSDKHRAKKNQDKYFNTDKISKKRSFINLQQIVKTPNIKIMPLSEFKNDFFYDLLENFYHYQKDNPNKQFAEIKDKIEIMLRIFELNDKLGILMSTRIELDEIEKIKDTQNIERMHLVYLIGNKKIDVDEIPSTVLSEKDRTYLDLLLLTYDLLKNINLKQINIQQNNNQLMQLYRKAQSNNYFINPDKIFEELKDVIFIFNGNMEDIEIIEAFLSVQRERKEEERIKIMEKAKKMEEARLVPRRPQKKKTKNNKKKSKREKLEEKYGKFDFDMFNL